MLKVILIFIKAAKQSLFGMVETGIRVIAVRFFSRQERLGLTFNTRRVCIYNQGVEWGSVDSRLQKGNTGAYLGNFGK